MEKDAIMDKSTETQAERILQREITYDIMPVGKKKVKTFHVNKERNPRPYGITV